MIDITPAAPAPLNRSPDPSRACLDVLSILRRNPAVQTVVITTGADVLGALSIRRSPDAAGLTTICHSREVVTLATSPDRPRSIRRTPARRASSPHLTTP